jgi:hypothetical protein
VVPPRSQFDWAHVVADESQFLCEISRFFGTGWNRSLDHCLVVGTTVLPDMLLGFTKKNAVDVGGDFGKEGDDVAGISPAAKNNNVG